MSTGQGLQVLVQEKIDAAVGVAAVTLVSADGQPLPSWTPGAHIDVHLPHDRVRQYSLCGYVNDNSQWRIAVRRDSRGRGGSVYIHDHLARGERFTVTGPRNHFRLQAADSYQFIAGGIGITPLLPMVAAAARARRPWRLAYGGRARESMAFSDELLAMYRGRVSLHPSDTCGRIDLAALLSEPSPGMHIYCCGPEGLLQEVADRCQDWPDGSPHIERFSPPDLPRTAANRPFEVEIASTGKVFEVGADETILGVLRRSGVNVQSMCQHGTCGTCETGVLAGLIDHRDSVLTPCERTEGTSMILCVSRAAEERLLLDL